MTPNARWQAIIAPQTLKAAWRKVKANRGSAGGDGVSPAEFESAAPRYIRELRDELISGTYQPRPCRRVLLPKKAGGHRRLMIPSIIDRVLHTAISETLEAELDAQFEDSSFAYRHGKSVAQAVARIELLHRRGYTHVVEADIDNYFDTIDHPMLMEKLAAIIPRSSEPRLFGCLDDVLDWQSSELGSPGRGLVQGSPLSPLLSNLYLDALDEAVEQDGLRIARFADDFVILCKSERKAEHAIELVRQVLAQHKLELQPEKTEISSFDEGLEFLGHLFLKSLAIRRSKGTGTSAPVPAETQPVDPSPLEHEAETDKRHTPAVTDEAAAFDPDDGVLYVNEANATLSVHNESFLVLDGHGHERITLAHRRVSRIEVGPDARADWQALENALASATPLAFVSPSGRSIATLDAARTQYARLQFDQARLAADERFGSAIARRLVEARLRNQRTQLFRLNRSQALEEIDQGLLAMRRTLRKLEHAPDDVSVLRGHEGEAGRLYWPMIGRLTKTAGSAQFKRTRPATDALNASINYLTFLLQRDVANAISKTRLHPGFGFLHAPRDYADALVYDLMEPFRAPLSEGLAVYLFNARRLRDEMFQLDGSGVQILSEGVRAIIKGYEKAVSKRINVTGLRRKLAWRQMMVHQANTLVRAIESDDPDIFIPYLMEA